MKAGLQTSKAPEPKRRLSRSLRLRLILWYGSLIAVALGFFALLFLFLTTDAIDTSVNGVLRTEARVAMLDVLDDVKATPPYWPDHLSMHVLDSYREPGVVVEVLDAQAQVRYLSTSGARIPLSNETTRTVLAGQPSVSYDTTVDGQHVRVQALPIPTRCATRSIGGQVIDRRDHRGKNEGIQFPATSGLYALILLDPVPTPTAFYPPLSASGWSRVCERGERARRCSTLARCSKVAHPCSRRTTVIEHSGIKRLWTARKSGCQRRNCSTGRAATRKSVMSPPCVTMTICSLGARSAAARST
jgi:hypothetical protein